MRKLAAALAGGAGYQRLRAVNRGAAPVKKKVCRPLSRRGAIVLIMRGTILFALCAVK